MSATVDLNEAQAQLIQSVVQAEGSDEVQALIAGLEESGGTLLLKRLVIFAARTGETGFLALCALLANDRGVREEAMAALRSLPGGDLAGPPSLETLKRRRLRGAWVAPSAAGLRLMTLWERERKLSQAYVFDLDTEGALTGFEASRNLEPTQVAGLVGGDGCRKLRRAEMKEMLRRAFSVAHAREMPLPQEYRRHRHYVEFSVFKP